MVHAENGHEALAVLEAALAPHRSAGRITVLLRHRPTGVHTTGDAVDAVDLLSQDGSVVTVRADYVLDATENGDLLPRKPHQYDSKLQVEFPKVIKPIEQPPPVR